MKLHVVLYEPEIPGNTGNILRTCMATGTRCHLIEPLGFFLDEKHLKRAGMDYISEADFSIHKSWKDFLEDEKPERMLFLSRYGKKTPREVDFSQSEKDLYLVFGKESTGIDKAILKAHREDLIRLPMISTARSLNLSNTVAIMVYEVLGALGYPGLSREEVLKGPDFLDRLEI